MQKFVPLLFSAALVLVGGTSLYSNLNGAMNMTGAPGEGNCTGCHFAASPVPSEAKIKVGLVGNPEVLEPGKTYEVVVETEYPGGQRFGFGLTSRQKNVLFQNYGEFEEIQGSGLKVSDYVTHTSSQTLAEGKKEWRVKWKAPESPNGPVTFYASGIIGNNDNTNEGDNWVMDSLTIPFGIPASIDTENDKLQLKISLDVEQRQIEARFNLIQESRVYFMLRNLEGKTVSSEIIEKLNRGEQIVNLNFPSGTPGGIYTIEIGIPPKKTVKKIVIR
ncbi:hypothetical protein MASR2M44_18650 [Bacteroidota bacterium]